MSFLNQILSLTLLFTVIGTIRGQEIKFHTPIGNISQNSISAITQDKDGFLWFGTRYGANRYNGLDYKTIFSEKDKKNGLRNSAISCFLNDNERNIWIGTLGGGISVFNIDLQSFNPKYDKVLESLNRSQISAMLLDSRGDIWISTTKDGLKVLKHGTDHLEHLSEKWTLKNNLTGIVEDQNKNIIFSSWGGGVCIYNPERDIFQSYTHENNELLPEDNIIRSICKGNNGVVWFGTQNGVLKLETNSTGNPVFSKLDFENPETNRDFVDIVIPSLLEDSQSRLWIGTENKGLFLYDVKKRVVSKFHYQEKGKYKIEGNSIWSLFEDRHGTLWIGTFKHGVKKVDPREQKFQHISANTDSKLEISYGLVSSFSEDENGNIWVGTDGGGLNFLKRDENFNIVSIQHPPFPGLESNVIVSLLKDKKDRLWVGTWGNGLFIKEKNETVFKQINYNPQKSKGPNTNDIMYLFEAPSGNIWICQYRAGLNLYVPDEDKFYQFEPSLNPNSISSRHVISVVEDSDGVVWVGSGDSGIDRFRLNEKNEIVDLKNFSVSDGKQKNGSENEVEYLHIDSKNVLWAGTEGGGLKKYIANEDKFISISAENGLPSDVVYGILDDGEKLWLSTAAGLITLDFENSKIRTYDVSDGLGSNEFARSSCYKTKEGMFLFGGTNGFNFFNPKNIELNSVIPDVYISGISLRGNDSNFELQNELNRQLSLGNIVLESGQNDLDFKFAALNYTQSGKNTYSYILENYDQQWKNVQNTTTASYTNIPPGNYVFKIKAANNDGIWNETPATTKVTISSPWHKTNLAYFCYFMGILGLMVAVYFAIVYRERLKNQLKMEQLERSKMEELNEVKSRFFANISHEFKTPLTLIVSPLKAIQKRLEKVENKNQVSVMLRNAERLQTLINQILALSKLESGSEKLKVSKFDIVDFCQYITSNFHNYAEEQFITFEEEFPDKPIDLYFEKDRIEKVLINLISNAFKFTPEFGRIIFSLKKEENFVKISVSDTGIGISREQLEHVFERFYRAGKNSGTGIGLSLSKQLIELHKGKIKVNSTEGRGTTFDIFLRLGKDHLDESQIYEVAPLHNLSEDSKIELKDFTMKTPPVEILQEIADHNVPLVLIAEDNPDIRAFTRTYLQTNYQIIEAENGLKAYHLAKKHIPDIVITDWMMPQMTGFELAQKLRHDEKTSHIFILMLTVKSSDESKEEGFGAGVDYYITKPFNPKLLDLRIQNILKTRTKYRRQILKDSIHPKSKKDVTEIKQPITISEKDQEFLNKIVLIIDENLNNSKLSIEFLCKQIGFSKSQFYRKMKGLVGQSGNEFIRSIRLRRAAELFLIGEMTVSEVTYKVGFNDLQYFRDCFKNQYEMTPKEYIQKAKKEA